MDNTMKVFSDISLEGWQVDGHDGAVEWARSFDGWVEHSTELQPFRHSALCIEELDNGVGVYYEWGSDHYFFVDLLPGEAG